MKTYFEIIENKNYRQLTTSEKEEIQQRQDYLVMAWQDETNDFRKEEIFDELYASLKGLVKAMAYKRAEKSFSLEQEDIEGIMYLVLVEQLIKYDRTIGKPFQPVFIQWVKFRMQETYRAKGYDKHEETYLESARLDHPTEEGSTMMDKLELTDESDFASDVVTNLVTDELLTTLYGDNEFKKTVVTMYLNDFTRSEIVSAINVKGKSEDAVVRQVNRTWSDFKLTYTNLMERNLI